jgi:hypothetical protein
VGGGTSVNNSQTRFFYDWYQVTYERELRARDDTLELSTELGTGNVLVRAQGFSGSDLLLFDVTDPENPAIVSLAPTQIVPEGALFDLRFDHDNSAAGAARFVAVRASQLPQIASASIRQGSEPSILAGGVGARYVVVAFDGDDLFPGAPSLMSGAQALADYRASRYTTIVAPVSSVYDIFNNGSRSPRAIKAYAAYAYHRWSTPLVFLTLFGDGNEDHRNARLDSTPDLLPSHSLFADYEGAPEDSDQYYGEMTRALPGGSFDDLVDIYVGRLPVGTPEELAWNLERIERYENEDLDASWRRRVLLMADDQISGSLGANAATGYGWQPAETGFENISREIADSLRADPHDAILPDSVYMSAYSHPCPDSCYSNRCAACESGGQDCGLWYDCRRPSVDCRTSDWPNEYGCMLDRMRPAVFPVLSDKLNDGVLIWNFQGHAHRLFLTHEHVFENRVSRRDVENSLTNDERPFIFLGFACHLAEFDKYLDRAVDDDCMAERMMNFRSPEVVTPGGAVAVFASSGFEFLGPNLPFNEFVMQAFFNPESAAASVLPSGTSLPTEPGAGRVYLWTLGESTTRSRLMFQMANPVPGRTRQSAQRYVLLGDPALEPRVGTPTLAVTINGSPVEDPSSTFFAEAEDFPGPIQVVVSAANGRGIAAMRVVEVVEGVRTPLDPAAYAVAELDTSSHGVARRKELTYEFALRAGGRYDLRFEVDDPSNKTTSFVMSVGSGIFDFQGGEPVVYPNPFRDRMTLVYKFTQAAEQVRLRVYTVTGRKVYEATEDDAKPANEQHVMEWDGRDSSGNVVGNGSYVVRFDASSRGKARSIETTMPCVKLR